MEGHFLRVAREHFSEQAHDAILEGWVHTSSLFSPRSSPSQSKGRSMGAAARGLTRVFYIQGETTRSPSLDGGSCAYYLLPHSRLATRSAQGQFRLHTPLERETMGDFYSGDSKS